MVFTVIMWENAYLILSLPRPRRLGSNANPDRIARNVRKNARPQEFSNMVCMRTVSSVGISIIVSTELRAASPMVTCFALG